MSYSVNHNLARGIFSSSGNETQCAAPKAHDAGAPLFGSGTITLRHLMIAISAPCLLLTIIACWFLSFRHLRRYTVPQEQRQILRIINLPIAYSVFNLLAMIFVSDYQFIEPIAAVYEAFSVAALFLLILEYVCPDDTDRETYFHQLENRDREGNVQPGGSLEWFQQTWSMVLQYPTTKTLIIVAQIITQYFHVYCESSFSPKHAHLWLQLIDYFFIGGALSATIRFGKRVGKEISPTHKLRAKMFSFIGILIFQLLQNLIFHQLNGRLFSPTTKATYNDINFGISSFMTCIEAVIFATIFNFTFSSQEYKEGARLDRYGQRFAPRTTTFRAVFNALNISDIVAGTVLAFKLLFMRMQSRYGGGHPVASGAYKYQQQEYAQGLNSEDGPAHDETHYAPGYNMAPMQARAAMRDGLSSGDKLIEPSHQRVMD